jgi:3-hydroxybutyryl-CoA dehydratase
MSGCLGWEIFRKSQIQTTNEDKSGGAMPEKNSLIKGKYFEEFEVDMTITSPGRTITESDIVTFAGLSGDYTQIHTDVEFSRSTLVGRRVAHGLLGMSVASGLAARTGVLEGTALAFREISEWKFIKPIFIGDTIHVLMTVIEVKGLPRLGGGAVSIELRVINQDDETLMRGIWKVLMASKPE